MKLLSLCIILSSLIISFHYVWINRLHLKEEMPGITLIVNKWTGNHCVFSYDSNLIKEYISASKITACQVDENGKITFP